jgi:putative transposase
VVKNKAVHVVPALNADGEKDVFELWIEQTEGPKGQSSGSKVVNEPKASGINDILIAVLDGLKPSRRAEWGKRYPAIRAAYVVPIFAFAPGIRKMIYTTNAVEALHRSRCVGSSKRAAAFQMMMRR